MVRERRKAYEPTASRCTILGVVLCILAVVPLMLGVGLASSDVAALLVRVAPADVYAAAAVDALLLLVACGVGVLVWSGTYTGAMDQLLEEGDYTRKKKARSGVMSTVSLIYWLSVTAISSSTPSAPGETASRSIAGLSGPLAAYCMRR